MPGTTLGGGQMAAFERCYCISLGRRGDRWSRFVDRLPRNWPLPQPQRFDAIDGSLCKPPSWWSSGRGAWGCYRSHLAILETCLSENVSSVVLLEDDVTFCSDFAKRVAELDVPGDCEQLYLGGQHLIAPEIHPSGLVRCRNVNRTHAYALIGKESILKAYQMLNETQQWVQKFHIDHTYGRLHEQGRLIAYAPSEWLCGQSDGVSDVCERPVRTRWWHQEPVDSDLPFVAILGLHRSGSSALAMLCHRLGISMGRKLTGYEGRHGGGGEAITLAWICENWARFPATSPSKSFDALGHLRAWIAGRVRDDKASGNVSGGKYPHLCAMGGLLTKACGSGLKIIDCRRPIDESIASLQARSQRSGAPKATPEEADRVQRWLWQERETLLQKFAGPVLQVEYNNLLEDPACVARQVAQFADREVDDSLIAASVAHINPSYRTVS